MKLSVAVLNCSSNETTKTYDGIDQCAYRIYSEIKNFLDQQLSKQKPDRFSKISFVGYSNGGLFLRYCIGLMQSVGFFEKENLTPFAFITIATPHLGIRKTSRTASGRLGNYLSSLVCNLYGGRTGDQVMLVDGQKHGGVPLLVQMSHPKSVFFEGLKKFSIISYYANVNNDNTVPYCTSSLSKRNIYYNLSERKYLKDEHTQYSFIMGIDKVDQDPSLLKMKELRVNMDWEIVTLLKTCLTLLILAFPIFILQCLIFIPIRISTLLFHHTDKQNECIDRTLTYQNGFSDPDMCPWLILNNLRQLHIKRINVFIPGFHTHGTIICRRFVNDGGKETIAHLCSQILGYK